MKFGQIFKNGKSDKNERAPSRNHSRNTPSGIVVTHESFIHKSDFAQNPAAVTSPQQPTFTRITSQHQDQIADRPNNKSDTRLPRRDELQWASPRSDTTGSAAGAAAGGDRRGTGSTNPNVNGGAANGGDTDTIQSSPPPALQASNENDDDGLTGDFALDLDGFDLAPPPPPRPQKPGPEHLFPLERKSLLMFSKVHMRIVFEDVKLLRRFSAFLVESRPEGVQRLAHHLDCRKALAAIRYSNSLAGLGDEDRTGNEEVKKRAEESFAMLANEDLPAWVTSVWVEAVERSIRMRINGSLPNQLRDMSEGLAETFCLSDPSRFDNPVLFASEEFNKLTQYSNKYVIGRNCRMLRGPKSNSYGTRRLRDKLADAQQHYEPVLNYRRDGSPFMNLLMITPLLDAQGKTRYFLGAQVDVSGLLSDFYGFEYLQSYMDQDGFAVESEEEDATRSFEVPDEDKEEKDPLRELCELFVRQELEVIRRHGGRLHNAEMVEADADDQVKGRLVIASESPPANDNARMHFNDDENGGLNGHRGMVWDGEDNRSYRSDRPMSPRGTTMMNGKGSNAMAGSKHMAFENNNNINGNNDSDRGPSDSGVTDPQSFFGSGQSNNGSQFDAQHGGQLSGTAYDHYLLVRPAPSLRILFASPSLRIPGMVQSNLMDRIGGSANMRGKIETALTRGQGVTARVKWISNLARRHMHAARTRWMHATPLLGREGEVGVWMVVLVDEEKGDSLGSLRSSAAAAGSGSVAGAGSVGRRSAATSVRSSVMIPESISTVSLPPSRGNSVRDSSHGDDSTSVLSGVDIAREREDSDGDELRATLSPRIEQNVRMYEY